MCMTFSRVEPWFHYGGSYHQFCTRQGGVRVGSHDPSLRTRKGLQTGLWPCGGGSLAVFADQSNSLGDKFFFNSFG